MAAARAIYRGKTIVRDRKGFRVGQAVFSTLESATAAIDIVKQNEKK